ncbi:MAG: histone deacetylase family protein [Thermoguttaceae bacterium]|jgi:acetoin utilization deacetylase AcuC-like enzyme/GNAT superfamily N-acetyltransferase|nr:histone deacetylase family protein [Thermoguttaceae bacterium]
MFRIRRIHDDVLPVNQDAIRQAERILEEHFTAASREEYRGLADRLRNPFRQQFRSVLLVAERQRGRVAGFAFLMIDPELGFAYLDFIASAKEMTGRGIGGALYQRVRQEATALGVKGLFFECLPDDPAQFDDPAVRKENTARLRFYERFGVLPIAGTDYEAPIKPDDRGMPHLMFDGLGRGEPLRRDFARKVVRAILQRKYAHLCPADYVDMVVRSFRDDPVRLREPRYVKAPAQDGPVLRPTDDLVALVVNDKHDIHHVRERGYVEAPVRIPSILAALEPTGAFERMVPRAYPDRHIHRVHDPAFVGYLRRVCAGVGQGRAVYPYVFPIRNFARPPKELSVRAGYYCIDTFTPLNANAYLAARRAVDCTLTAADALLAGRRVAYALVRPPGHHAERRCFGGFCYFNNAAIAAQYLTSVGKVAMLDVDYHHGNGQQDIFYRRDDVLTVSIHASPNVAYPYFSGFDDERGEGPGEGFNRNFPLPEHQDGPAYQKALAKALRVVAEFNPSVLVLAFGLDTARSDPTGTWNLSAKDFQANGRIIAGLGLPTLVVQEGGYRTRTLGVNARHFFEGLLTGP